MSKSIGKICVSLIFFMMVGMSIRAQKLWSLQECIDYAVANNLTIKKSTLQNKINKENYEQTKRNILPSLSFSSSSSFNFGKSIDPNTNDYVDKTFFSAGYSFSASMDLFDGFSKLNRISYNKLNYLAGLEDDKREKNDIAFKVMDAYFYVLFYDGLLEIAKEQKQVSELSLKQAKSMVEAGLKAKADLLEMESRMAEEEVFVVQTLNSKNEYLLSLKQLMNYGLDENFNIGKENTLMFAPGGLTVSQDSVLLVAKENNPFIKSGVLRKLAAEKYLAIIKSNLYPYLGMNSGYSTSYSALVGSEDITPVDEQFKNNASQYVGVSLSIPIFNRWANRSNIKLAQLNLEQAQVDLDLNIQQINQEIEKNFQDLFALSSEFEQMVNQRNAAELAFQSASKKLEQGLINAIDYYNSKNLLARAKSNLLSTKLKYELKSRTIDFFMGIPIYSTNKTNQ